MARKLSLDILDDKFEQELLRLPAPLAFIDFEAFMPSNYVIPGVEPTSTIPCQWSCHVMGEHGLNWRGNLEHFEFLWVGDMGWNPIYAFAHSLFEATATAQTILIYTDYERRCLEMCIRCAENDMALMQAGQIPEDYLVCDVVFDKRGHAIQGEYVKVPLMQIAPQVRGWCESMLNRFYDMCYGLRDNSAGARDGGVMWWLQSPDFHNSNSIKHIFPVASQTYSETAQLLESEGLPINGYEGLAGNGMIAKGDQCTSAYSAALNRPPLEVNPEDPFDPSYAPFDSSIEYQCLIYCRLDTLAMVVIYLAVLEETEQWRTFAEGSYADYAKLEDGMFHSIEFDGDAHGFRTVCNPNCLHDASEQFEVISEYTFETMPLIEQYGLVCPDCRRIVNEWYRS